MFSNYTSYRTKINTLAVLALLCLPFCGGAQVITTYAGSGNGSKGFAGDGNFATYAVFNNPQGMLLDKHGNLYISDQFNNRIRKVNKYGIITTIAGSGTAAGSTGDGGPADKAKLNAPAGMAMDTIGNLYFADSKNHRIRKIDTGGIITTVVGNGIAGYNGDTVALNTKLNEPLDVAFDAAGNMYIADNENNRIRKVDVTGKIMTIAGNGIADDYGNGVPATAARLNKPAAVAIAKDGGILIADSYNNMIRKIGTDSVIRTIAGNGTPGFGGDNGVVGVSQLNLPSSLAVDRTGNIYFADTKNNRVRKIDPTGRISTVAGNGSPGGLGDGGPAVEAQLYSPSCVAVDTAGNLYVDEAKNRIRYVFLGVTPSDEKLLIFPNPCQKYTSTFFPSLYEEMATIFVYNMEGREVSRTSAPTNKYVDIHFDASGTYIIYAVTKHNKWRGKVIALQ